MNRLKQFFLNAIILTLTAILIRTIGMYFNVFLSQKIGTEGIGLFQLIMSVYLFATTIANSGIYLAATRIVAEELACNSETGAKIAIHKCLIYSLIFGLIASCLLVLFAPFLSQTALHGKISNTPLYIIAISLPFVSMGTSINGYFTGVRKAYKNSFSQVISTILNIGLTIFLLNYLSPTSIEGACGILVVSNTLAEIISFLYLYLLYQIDKRKLHNTRQESDRLLYRILRISLPVAITSYIRSGLSTLKQMLIPLRLEKSGLSCERSLSEYGMINGMVMPMLFFPSVLINSFANILVPEFARYKTKKDYQRINEMISIVFRPSLFFSLGITGIFMIFSDQLSIAIYHNIEISHFVKMLAPIISIMYLDNIVDSILKGLDKQVGVMACNIIDLFVSISLIYCLLPIYGIYGYLLVIFTSEILHFVISIYQLYRLSHFKFEFLEWLLKPTCCIFLSYFTLSLLQKIWYFSSFITEIVLFLLFYLFFLFVFSKKEKPPFQIQKFKFF